MGTYFPFSLSVIFLYHAMQFFYSLYAAQQKVSSYSGIFATCLSAIVFTVQLSAC